jgi:hypothetical protein
MNTHHPRTTTIFATHLHVHPFAESAQRLRHWREAVHSLVLLQVLKSLMPQLVVGIGNNPLEADPVQLFDTITRQMLAISVALPPFPIAHPPLISPAILPDAALAAILVLRIKENLVILLNLVVVIVVNILVAGGNVGLGEMSHATS